MSTPMISEPFQPAITGRACPFCGVAADVPHETQEVCIEALHVEIARMRGVLDHLRPLRSLNSTFDHPKEPGA